MSAFGKKSYTHYLAYVFSATTVIFFLLFFMRYAVNVPFLDDFKAVLGFLTSWTDATSWPTRLGLLFSQHNEHRIVFTRLIVLLVHIVGGSIDMRILMWVGNLTLVGLIVVLWQYFKRLHLNPWYFVPIALLLFQPNFYDNIFWGMAALENLGVIFFSLLSLYLLSLQKKQWFFASLGFALLAVFTNGNGLFAVIVGALILWRQARRQELKIWLAVFMLATALYFFNYHNPNPSLFIRFLSMKNLALIVFALFQFFGSFLAFVDPAASVGIRHAGTRTFLLIGAAEIAGIIVFLSLLATILTAFIHAMPDQWRCLKFFKFTVIKNTFRVKAEQVSQSLFALAGIMFILITALAFAVNRANVVIPNRYKMYPMLALIFGYFLCLIWFSDIWRKRLLLAIFPLSLFFCLYSYYYNSFEIHTQRKMLLASSFDWTQNHMGLINPLYAVSEAEIYMELAQRQDFCNMPDFFASALSQRLSKVKPGTYPIELAIAMDENNIRVSGQTSVVGNGLDDGTYVVLRSKDRTYVFATIQQPAGLLKFMATGRLYSPGFKTVYMPYFLPADIPKSILSGGLYQVGTFTVDGQDNKLEFSNQFIQI